MNQRIEDNGWVLSDFRAGEWVEVRSSEEIMATLDNKGCHEGMPFMPEMLAWCGRTVRVAAVAHKTCDPAHKTGGRRINRVVHLEASRCNGSAHGGCQAECNIFWKDVWLKRPSRPPSSELPVDRPLTVAEKVALPTGTQDTYSCQATELIHASHQLPWWNVRQYFLDIVSRNHPPGLVLKVLALSWTRQLLRVPFGYRIWSRINDRVHRLLTGLPAPIVSGEVASGQQTPTEHTNLQPGDSVRVKPLNEIVVTLDRNSKNRGMWFDVEQTYFCEQDFKVHRRVTKIIDERTGKMMEMKNPCITLDGVVCSGHYSADRLLCPRAITPYWREIWLRRNSQQQ